MEGAGRRHGALARLPTGEQQRSGRPLSEERFLPRVGREPTCRHESGWVEGHRQIAGDAHDSAWARAVPSAVWASGHGSSVWTTSVRTARQACKQFQHPPSLTDGGHRRSEVTLLACLVQEFECIGPQRLGLGQQHVGPTRLGSSPGQSQRRWNVGASMSPDARFGEAVKRRYASIRSSANNRCVDEIPIGMPANGAAPGHAATNRVGIME